MNDDLGTLRLKPSGGAAIGKVALKELEEMMLFDQSQSSKWPKVTIYVEAGGGDDDAIQIWPNGRPWNIQRSFNVAVAPEVVDILHNCMTAVMVKDPNANGGYVSRDVLKFPFRVVDSQSQRRYDQWKWASDALRHVVTETKIKEVNGKNVFEITNRYLTEEYAEKAVELTAWAQAEKAKETAHAADLRKEVT